MLRQISIIITLIFSGLFFIWILVDNISFSQKGSLEILKADILKDKAIFKELNGAFCRLKDEKNPIFFNYFFKVEKIEFLSITQEANILLNEDSVLLEMGQSKSGLIHKMMRLNLENCQINGKCLSYDFSNSHAFISDAKVINSCDMDKNHLDSIQNVLGFKSNLYVPEIRSYISISKPAISPAY